MHTKSHELIQQYYAAFNAQDLDQFFSLLAPEILHQINQGHEEHGIDAFAKFMHHMAACYREHISSLVIMVNDDGSRASSEFIVKGEYLSTDSGLPEAKGQTYQLPGGAFFSIRNDKITRVTNYYNMQDWLAQVQNA